jgi:hypothetical protein
VIRSGSPATESPARTPRASSVRRGRSAAAHPGYLTRSAAEEALQSFLREEGGRIRAASGIMFGEAELRPRWGDRRIGAITRSEVDAYRAQLAKRHLAPTTVNPTRAITRAIFAMVELNDDPSLAFERAKTRRSTSDAISFYRPDEIQRLVAEAESEQDATFKAVPWCV